MEREKKERFMNIWEKYFAGAQLPVTFWYTDDGTRGTAVKPSPNHRCAVGDIARAMAGRSVLVGGDILSCFGAKRYFGFTREIMPNFDYFLSCGIPGELEGERYKKSPEIVRKMMASFPSFTAPGRYLVFKRWDKLDEKDCPDVVVFLGPPDVISGVFTLFYFDEVDRFKVVAPFGAGCTTIVLYPFLESQSEEPRAILGMFDVSARPCMPATTLSLSVPMKKFDAMIENVDESFLTGHSWEVIRKRLARTAKKER